MLFASFDFLLFFVPVALAFWALRRRPVARTAVLIAASYWFYMGSARPVGDQLPAPWYFVGLLGFSTLLDYVCSARIHTLSPKARGLDGEPSVQSARRRRNLWLIASLTGNLGLLGYFKYTNFFIEAFTDVANAMGAELIATHLDLVLPIGISFYTFQSLSYTIDVWRGRLTPEPNFWKFALFVVFFPQLVAGPIVRASEFLPQLHRRPRIDREDVEWGLFRIFKGLLKKVVLGDFIAAYFTDIVFAAPGDYTSLENLLALYAFTLQIYADFAGYSDIAIGVARLLGFKIPENFDRPYQAHNLGEFWRRWHMTLSTWLRDYLFFPLGGSRGSTARTYFNLWLTMFLVGMWHGASWNFVIYSNLHGFAMLFNRWNRLRDREGSRLRRVAITTAGAAALGGLSWFLGAELLGLESTAASRLGGLSALLFVAVVLLPDTGGRLNAVLHVGLTFHFTVISRIFFRADDLDLARTMSDKLLRWDGHGVRPGLFRIQNLAASIEAQAEALGAFVAPAQWLAEYGLLLLLLGGTAYHFTPRRWVDETLVRHWRALPGPVVGVLFALLGLLVLHLLQGPRANIYFAF